MLKERLNGYAFIEYRWLVLAKLIFICFVFVIAYLTTTSVMDRGKPADVSHVSDNSGFKRAGRTAWVKPAVVEWMKQNSEMPEQLLASIYDVAEMHINTELILAICMVESNFNPDVRSSKGAVGLMGIMPAVWFEELKANGIVTEKKDLFLIRKNIASGIYVLGKYLERTNNLEKALLNYVGGDSEYVKKILQALGEIYHVKMGKARGDMQKEQRSVAGDLPAGANSG